MREIRQSGSEGGGEVTLSPYPYHWVATTFVGPINKDRTSLDIHSTPRHGAATWGTLCAGLSPAYRRSCWPGA